MNPGLLPGAAGVQPGLYSMRIMQATPGRHSSPGKRRSPDSQLTSRMRLVVRCSMRAMPSGPGLAHPGGESGREQGGVDAVHQDGEPSPAGDAVLVGQVAAQEVEVGRASCGDVVAVGDGGADHEQQELGQGVGDAAHVARVVDGGEVVQQHAKTGLLRARPRDGGMEALRIGKALIESIRSQDVTHLNTGQSHLECC